jgi:putative Mn2+ efflux pump MntP
MSGLAACRHGSSTLARRDGYLSPVLALVLVALSLGLSNFAAAIGIGVTGVDARTRVRVGVVFGIFEAGMPILGLALGHSLASTLGRAARWTGGGLLIATGAYGLIQALRASAAGAPDPPADQPQLGRLLVTGLALSIDNLAVGFALGTYHVSLPVAAAVIGAVSVVMSLAGLELGARIGMRAGQRGELLGGLVLIGVGVAIGTGVI